jgi:hypothetical protein
MNYASSRSHPLHVTGMQDRGVPERVSVLLFSGNDIGHRLKAAMGMIWKPNGLAGSIMNRPLFVQYQEGVESTYLDLGQHPTESDLPRIDRMDFQFGSHDRYNCSPQ